MTGLEVEKDALLEIAVVVTEVTAACWQEYDFADIDLESKSILMVMTDDQGDTLEQVAATESIIISTPKDVLDKMNSWYILHVQPSVLPQLQFCFTQGVSDSTESQD